MIKQSSHCHDYWPKKLNKTMRPKQKKPPGKEKKQWGSNPHEIYNSTKTAKRLTGPMRHGRNQSESQEQGPTLKKETAQATSEYKK
jgi:hypothetical protein